jgi:hypothetical protein
MASDDQLGYGQYHPKIQQLASEAQGAETEIYLHAAQAQAGYSTRFRIASLAFRIGGNRSRSAFDRKERRTFFL